MAVEIGLELVSELCQMKVVLHREHPTNSTQQKATGEQAAARAAWELASPPRRRRGFPRARPRRPRHRPAAAPQPSGGAKAPSHFPVPKLECPSLVCKVSRRLVGPPTREAVGVRIACGGHHPACQRLGARRRVAPDARSRVTVAGAPRTRT